MVIKFITKALKWDKNSLIVRKTDDEVTRYLKQKRIQSERIRYNTLVEQETERQKQGLNTEEKKMLHHSKIQNIDYDRTKINDTKLNFDYLTLKQNYNPMGKHQSFLQRMLYINPLYSQSKEMSLKPSLHHYIVRFFGCLFLLKFGYSQALADS